MSVKITVYPETTLLQGQGNYWVHSYCRAEPAASYFDNVNNNYITG